MAYFQKLNTKSPYNTEVFYDDLEQLSDFELVPIDDLTSFLFPFVKELVHERLSAGDEREREL